ncbi:DNA-binding MarR family transcriptional regulator [Breznakia sp. PF5-3]|uniref:MarR family winged helix-turn-helix transcriptional regulator n=1 Tax=unclassified Breznakia TaxID=2623764 RepID=UPI002407349A|nr:MULTISPECIES: winged helix DNA-binding protein [unclassified Breznakia]MDL2276501.1 winged helix DNA-binding protein [Breznakia sp. OttesenSCG-928-G09]MDF9824255.1 DNA-binding MarR family transcriptional regulator [Breznakia sp. PM6-1]MDF9835178.1 DNA-binding MarR family transcriptional regulator [Breznakia sp. PF5-3]MDF9837290.1 DNA-binding MarR family transcriptional regulator [Breznakia sp. PFB2-8]MDF9859425.1 DNA-binding MarR family transcriptional regulator [Breznakia sp. PH5-24]
MNWELIKKSEKLRADMQSAGMVIMQPFYEKHGMNYLKLAIISEAEENDNLTLNALSRSVSKATANMSVVVTHLVNDGYLKKVPSAYDGRVTYIQLTKKGKKLLEASHDYVVEKYSDIMDGDKELQDLIEASEAYLAKIAPYR